MDVQAGLRTSMSAGSGKKRGEAGLAPPTSMAWCGALKFNLAFQFILKAYLSR